MKKAAAHTTTLAHEQHLTAAPTHTKLTVWETVWRIVTPVVVFTVIGILADNSVDAKPWLALLGLMVGSVVAGLLIKRQIGDLPSDEK
jgi:F0F1-type ATP synthase assembly protein I